MKKSPVSQVKEKKVGCISTLDREQEVFPKVKPQNDKIHGQENSIPTLDAIKRNQEQSERHEGDKEPSQTSKQKENSILDEGRMITTNQLQEELIPENGNKIHSPGREQKENSIPTLSCPVNKQEKNNTATIDDKRTDK